jgi:hypothetical protein
MLKYFLTDANGENQSEPTAKQMITQLCACLLFGALLGVLAKYSDTVPATNSPMGVFFDFISSVTTHLGIWVLIGAIIAAGSRSPKAAAINVLVFFAGMLLAYYKYTQILFGFFPTYYFLRWGSIAIASPFAAYLVWFSKGKGWFAAFCAALPIGLLLSQGYPFFYSFSSVRGFDILAALLLLALLPRQKVQYLRVAATGVLIAFILSFSNILPYIFGGL